MEANQVINNLRVARENAGLSQIKLAERCGWMDKHGNPAQSSVSSRERGKRGIGVEELLAWAKACGVAPGDLFTGIDPTPKVKQPPIIQQYASLPPELRAALNDLVSTGSPSFAKFFADMYWSVKALYEKEMEPALKAEIDEYIEPPVRAAGGINLED